MTATDRQTIRCAIYTRKSSDEGLDQTFNSLDAQREACESYIASQRHEGWKLIPARYDDGGLSGGNLDRPALQTLLSDIAAGRIDLVVVYKIDRLTRSLADFAKLVERFDAANCSFVSVTQSFNTSTSMGRLTLNVLLSFAQFEREVTAERIRDKIAASKKKGYWMGGLLPLGYDQHPDPKMRTLVINEREAGTVREIFRLYRDLGCLRLVEQQVAARGYTSKLRTFSNGRTTGGRSLNRGQINFILRNPVYTGRIRHKLETHDGLHEAIIDPELWGAVQERLDRNSPKKSRRPSKSGALLTGRIFDETGDFLTPTHAQKGGRRYHYYSSARLLAGEPNCADAWRLPARQVEDAVVRATTQHLRSMAAQMVASPSRSDLDRIDMRLTDIGRSDVCSVIERVDVSPGQMTIRLDTKGLEKLLGADIQATTPKHFTIEAPFRLRRRGVESKLTFGSDVVCPDQTLVRAVADAHLWLEEVRGGTPVMVIAERVGRPPAKLARRMRLAFLSPSIVEAILDGRQPAALTFSRLMRMDIPADWDAQWRDLGFADAA